MSYAFMRRFAFIDHSLPENDAYERLIREHSQSAVQVEPSDLHRMRHPEFRSPGGIWISRS
jgi:hypothetical protein